jgi:hypothetical protein
VSPDSFDRKSKVMNMKMNWLVAILAALALSGCGTHWATVKNQRGDDVMLLGHDPVAYFTTGKPTRGKNEI